jgi:hypothetical protein
MKDTRKTSGSLVYFLFFILYDFNSHAFEVPSLLPKLASIKCLVFDYTLFYDRIARETMSNDRVASWGKSRLGRIVTFLCMDVVCECF